MTGVRCGNIASLQLSPAVLYTALLWILSASECQHVILLLSNKKKAMSSLHFTLSVFLPVSSHDESLPDTGEQRRRGVGCMCPEVGGLLSPPPAVADWRPRHQWQARLELCGPIRGQAVHRTYVYI